MFMEFYQVLGRVMEIPKSECMEVTGKRRLPVKEAPSSGCLCLSLPLHILFHLAFVEYNGLGSMLTQKYLPGIN